MPNLANIFYKIKNLLKKILKKDNILELPENKIASKNISQNNFTESLQKDFKNNNTKTNILNLITQHPHLLYELSIERLEQLNQIYDKKIAESTIKINELQTKKTS